MLIKIFEYLSTWDRKSVKLVCRTWCQVCCDKMFQRTEQFIIPGLYQTSYLVELLESNRYCYLHLHLYGFDLTSVPIATWKHHGWKIRSLSLNECTINNDVLENVITFCDNLSSLALKYDKCRPDGLPLRFSPIQRPPWELNKWHYYMVKENNVDSRLIRTEREAPRECKFLKKADVCDRLIWKKVVRKELSSLSLNLKQTNWISNATLSGLFDVFPNITYFSIHLEELDKNFLVESTNVDTSSRKFLTLSVLLDEFINSRSIETLKVSFGMQTRGATVLKTHRLTFTKSLLANQNLFGFVCAFSCLSRTKHFCHLGLESEVTF